MFCLSPLLFLYTKRRDSSEIIFWTQTYIFIIYHKNCPFYTVRTTYTHVQTVTNPNNKMIYKSTICHYYKILMLYVLLSPGIYLNVNKCSLACTKTQTHTEGCTKLVFTRAYITHIYYYFLWTFVRKHQQCTVREQRIHIYFILTQILMNELINTFFISLSIVPLRGSRPRMHINYNDDDEVIRMVMKAIS